MATGDLMNASHRPHGEISTVRTTALRPCPDALRVWAARMVVGFVLECTIACAVACGPSDSVLADRVWKMHLARPNRPASEIASDLFPSLRNNVNAALSEARTCLNDQRPFVARAALILVQHFRQSAISLKPDVVRHLFAGDSSIATEATLALVAIDCQDARVLPSLIQALEHPADEFGYQEIQGTLDRLQYHEGMQIASVLSALTSAKTPQGCRCALALWLKRIAVQAPIVMQQAAAQALRICVNDPAPSVRRCAVESIGCFRDPSIDVARLLSRCCSDSSSPVRATAARALGCLAADSQDVITALTEMVNHETDARALAAALFAVAYVCPGRAELRDRLTFLANYQDADVRQWAQLARDPSFKSTAGYSINADGRFFYFLRTARVLFSAGIGKVDGRRALIVYYDQRGSDVPIYASTVRVSLVSAGQPARRLNAFLTDRLTLANIGADLDPGGRLEYAIPDDFDPANSTAELTVGGHIYVLNTFLVPEDRPHVSLTGQDFSLHFSGCGIRNRIPEGNGN